MAINWNGNYKWPFKDFPTGKRLFLTCGIIDEMPYGEMSEILETSEGSLKSQLSPRCKKN